MQLKSRLRFQLLAKLPPPPGHQPTASTSATARRGQSFRDSSAASWQPLCGLPGLRELGGEAEGASGGRQAALALSLQRSVGNLSPARGYFP